MPDTAADQQAEIEALRARVAELERELADRTERANAAVAAAEDRVYWLDRWHIDLDAIMARPLAQRAYAAAGSCVGRSGSRPRPPPPDAMSERVSAVIPVKDGARYLGEVLAALAREGVDEVLVIDSGSRDDSVGDRARGGRHRARDPAGRVRARPHAQPRRRAHDAAT